MEPLTARGAPEIESVTEPSDDGAPDIVGPTGEDMPLAMHDQGHRVFREPAPEQAFDPRLKDRRP
jgi:hypothetical protein